MSIRTTLLGVAVAAAMLVGFAFPQPTSDGGASTSTYRSSDNVELVTRVGPANGGTDIEFFSRTLSVYRNADGEPVVPDEPVERHFAAVGNQSVGAQIVDITDPQAPFVASRVQGCAVGQGDTQVNEEGTLLVVAHQTSGSCRDARGRLLPRGSVLVDLRDVYTPQVITSAEEALGAHNSTLHPGGRYLYISTSSLTPAPAGGATSRVPIYDLAGWESWDQQANWKPRLVQQFAAPVNGPHDIRFSHDGTRAYFAGISAFHIVNTEDVERPALISSIVAPGSSIGHDTLVTKDKRFLFLGDEAGGGATFPCPGGAIYVYDLTDERAPILLGIAEAGGGPVIARDQHEVPGPTRTGGCTAHVMHLNPDGRSLSIGWYRLGTRVFSFESFYDADGNAKPVAGLAAAWGKYGVGLVETGWIIPDNANTWSAKQYEKVPGYIFSNDTNLGMYVSKISS